MAEKKLIQGQPKFNDLSQYNFENQSDGYEESLGLPKNNGKFENKDLYTKSVGDELNNAIIERNLKFEGVSLIKIDKLTIEDAGVSGDTTDNDIRAYMFSQAYSNLDNKDFDYIQGTLNQLITEENGGDAADRFFKITRGNVGDGDFGTALEDQVIIQNLNSDEIKIEDFPNNTPEYNANYMFRTLDSETNLNTKIIDESTINPIYIVIYMKGNRHRNNISNKDRERRYQVFKIPNTELFDYDDSGFATGKTTTFQYIRGQGGIEEYYATSDKYGDITAAWLVGELSLTISTDAGVINDWEGNPDKTDTTDERAYEKYFSQVLTSYVFNPNDIKLNNLLDLSPNRQLNNTEDAGTDRTDFFPDYFPQTTINVVGKDNQPQDLDLQSYYNDIISSIRSSAPSTISIKIEPINIDNEELNSNMSYFCFLIDWDDKDNKIKTLDDWQNNRPNNLSDLVELQNQGLYEIKSNLPKRNPDGSVDSVFDYIEEPSYFINNTDEFPVYFEQFDRSPDGEINLVDINGWAAAGRQDIAAVTIEMALNCNTGCEEYPRYSDILGTTGETPTFSHTYTTPGIKTIKTIMFSYNYLTNQVGRWKLATSRFYLDIPINQYPDFAEVGGSDYTTIPWPFTTPIIGGVDEDSKYKISVQDALSSGNIGDTDIIDERFLVNDLENDEMGKSIREMDLEQIRYFNKSYDINTLLNIPTNYYDYIGENIFNETDASTFHGYNGSDGASPDVETPDENGYYIASRLGLSEELITNGDFTADGNQSQVTTNTLTGWAVNHSNDTLDYISLNNNQLTFNNLDSNFNLYIASPSYTVEDGKTYLVKVDVANYTASPPRFELGGGTNQVHLTNIGMNEFEWTPDFSLDDGIVTGKVVIGRGYQNASYPSSFTLNSVSVSELGQGINTEFLMSEIPSVQGNTIYEQSFKLKTDAEVSLLTITFYDPDGASNGNPNGTHNEITATLEYLGDEDNDGNYVYRVSANETLWSSQTRLRAIDFFIQEGWAPNITFVGVKDISLRELGTAQRYENLHNDFNYWDGKTSETTFPMESSVGQIFISDNLDLDLKQSCKLELNTGELTGKSIYDSSGNSNKGLLIGDYKVKKNRKGNPMRRDSFIKVPKKTSNTNGAL